MKPKFSRLWLTAAILGLAAGPCPASPRESDGAPAVARLESMVRDIVKEADGTFGVAVEHLESGARFAVDGDGLFPMASVVKLPILTEVMFQVREGKFGLADAWEVLPSDQFYDGSLLWARIDRLLAPAESPSPARRVRLAWSLPLCGITVLGAALAAEAVWLGVHAATEGLVRFLP